MPTKSHRTTLLEVLVVLFCVGVVVALLLSSVGRFEIARPAACQNKVRAFAQAAILYETSRGYYPGYCNDFGTFQGGLDPSDSGPRRALVRSHRKIGTWAVALLPNLDQQAIYETWTEDRYPIAFTKPHDYGHTSGLSGDGFSGLAAANIHDFQCPSDMREIGFGRNSYTCNTGMHPKAGLADFAQSMAAANGVFNNQFPGMGVDGKPVSIGPRVSSADLKDGLSSTLLFSENINALPWHRPGITNALDLVVKPGETEINYPKSVRYAQGLVWHYEDDQRSGGAAKVSMLHRINGKPPGMNLEDLAVTETNCADLARPSSNHANGVNASFADGATRFISDTIDYQIYQALLTPHGAASDVPAPEFFLTDEIQ